MIYLLDWGIQPIHNFFIVLNAPKITLWAVFIGELEDRQVAAVESPALLMIKQFPLLLLGFLITVMLKWIILVMLRRNYHRLEAMSTGTPILYLSHIRPVT